MTNNNSKVHIPTNPKTLHDIAYLIDDICDMRVIIKSTNVTISDQKKALADNYDLDSKAINLMVKVREMDAAGSNDVSEDYFETQDEYHTMYQSIFKLNHCEKK